MKKAPDYYAKRLADLEGYIPDGVTPKLRMVFAPEAKRPHGKWAGTPKYCDPETGKPLECWILECWYPAEMCGPRDSWDYDFLGIYPADCNLECCRGGFYGIRTPITVNGEYIELTEDVLRSIEQKQMRDVAWSMLSEKQMLAELDANLSEREKKTDADSFTEYLDILDHYHAHKEELDGADTRVWTFPEHLASTRRGAKEAIGRPNIKI